MTDATLDKKERGDDSAEEERDRAGWDIVFEDDSGELPWGELDAKGRVIRVVTILLKLSIIVGALYIFICCLSWLADGFRLVAGRQAGEVFRNSELFNNPIAGMLVGVLVTVLVQSSSTSTSIVVTMVAAELLTVTQAISLIMGANIGTSVTSTIVAIGQSGDADDFRRAFAAATVHDMFNFLTVLILLPVEAATGYLNRLSGWFISLSPNLASGEKPPDMLKVLTNPLVKEISSVDKRLITALAAADTPEALAELEDRPMLKRLFGCVPADGTCDLSDGGAGVIVLLGSLFFLCLSLFIMVKMLKALLKGRIAVWLYKTVNGTVPDFKIGDFTIPLGWLSGYIAIAVGFGVTIMVQSSSITTSALTPLVGVGVIKIDRMYPTVLGANIGTCVTGVLAALAASSSRLHLTLQVAYAHLLFNITGIAIFYGIWPLRQLPISAAKFLGDTTAKYKWFAATYIGVAFLIIPAIFMGFSFAGTACFVVMISLTLTVLLVITIINVMQRKCPDRLPEKLRTWEFLPPYLRSLEPLDRLVCLPLSQYLQRTMPWCCGAKKSKKGSELQAVKVTSSSAAVPDKNESSSV